MIGYDVGARIGPEDHLSGVFGDTDAPLLRTESGDGGDDGSGDVSDDTEALSDAAEVAGKIDKAGATGEGFGADEMPRSERSSAVFGGFSPDGDGREALNVDGQSGIDESFHADRDHDRVLDHFSATVESQLAAARIGSVDGVAVPQSFELSADRSEFEGEGASTIGSPAAPDVSDYAGQTALDGYLAAYEENGEEGGQQRDPTPRVVGGAAFDVGQFDESIRASMDAQDDLADSRPNQLIGSGLFEEAGERSGIYNLPSDEVPPGGEPEPMYNQNDSEREPEDFQPKFYGLQTAARASRVERLADQQGLDEAAVDNSGRMKVASAAASSSLDALPVEQALDLAGLWGMLRNAERVLPKPGFAGAESGSKAVADGVAREPGGPLGSLVKLFASEVANRREENFSNLPPDKVSPAGGRAGPSGNRNDPIYTVAMGSAGGTLMPIVPTPGTSTRSPPIPGQRNLA